MNFNEIKEKLQSGEKLIKLINIKYATLITRKTMINNTKDLCLVKDCNGLLKIDITMKSIFELIYILINYTDINFEDLYNNEGNINSLLAIEIYDYCKQYKLYDFVLENSNCNDFIIELNDEINQEIEINNSVSSILSQALNRIIERIPSQEGLGQIISEIPNFLTELNNTKPTKKRKSL